MIRLDRLRELVRRAGSESATSSGSVTAGRNGVEPDAEWVAQALGGSLEPSPEGAYVVVRRTYGEDSRHGRRAIREYPMPSQELLGVLGGQSSGPSTVAETGSVVCLDLETTGLRGGAGTFAFVVGFGWFEQGAFRTHQFVLSQLSAERWMLQAAAEVVGRATTLLTFNGKSFDVPVMATRWALHRLPSPLEALRHVDLLHPARRLWRSDEGRLASLERAVLGLRRVDDVPGAEVPGRYVAFLRSGDPRLLGQILEHNRLDLVSLGVLAGLACQLVRDGATAGTDPEQALGLGRIYERVGCRDATITCYRRAARTDGTPTTRAEALRRLALHHRREQRHVEAADAWQRLLELPGLAVGLRQEASVALAVYHEHRAGNLRTAQRFAEQALETEWHPRRRSAVEHRLRRLGRKIAARPAKCGSLLAAGLEGAMTPNGEPKTSFAAPPAAVSGWRR